MIAILPVLLETFAVGSVAVVAGMAVWYLFKHEKSTPELAQKNDPIQADVSTTTTPQKQDLPEPVAEPIVQESTPSVMANSREETVDDEPMLKRHHLHNIRLMLEATTFTRPTDSMLSRHYDEMIEAKAEDCLENEAKMARLLADYEACQSQNVELVEEVIEEESMLKRHHLHSIRLMLEATTFSRPTDSALSRHYDEMIDAKAEDCLENEAKMARLIAEYEAYEKAQLAKENVAVEAEVQATAVKSPCYIVPEDSMLRRHFLTHLRAMIEKNKAPCPTDSALRRHYETMINAEIESYLAYH